MSYKLYQRMYTRLFSLPDIIDEDSVPITETAMSCAKDLLDWCSEKQMHYDFLICDMVDEGGVRFEWDVGQWFWSVDVRENGFCDLHGCTKNETVVTRTFKQNQFEQLFGVVEFISKFEE